MINKKILITGGNSRFGKELSKSFFGKDIIYTSREQLDILDNKSIDSCLKKYGYKSYIFDENNKLRIINNITKKYSNLIFKI